MENVENTKVEVTSTEEETIAEKTYTEKRITKLCWPQSFRSNENR